MLPPGLGWRQSMAWSAPPEHCAVVKIAAIIGREAVGDGVDTGRAALRHPDSGDSLPASRETPGDTVTMDDRALQRGEPVLQGGPKAVIVTGVIGSDTHIVGNRILSMALEQAGYKVVSLG